MKLSHLSTLAVLVAPGRDAAARRWHRTFPPLDYSYLPPLVLKVANVNIVNNYVPGPDTAALLAQDPEPPANALLGMLNHRVVASGAPGMGTVTVRTALDQSGRRPVDRNADRGCECREPRRAQHRLC